MMLSYVVIHGKSADSWKTTRRSTPGRETGLPSIVIEPLLGLSKPASRRISVLLPQPEGPIMTVSLPRSMVKEQSLTTVLAKPAAP